MEKVRKQFLKLSALLIIVIGMITFLSSETQIISQNTVLEKKFLESIQNHEPISISNNSDFSSQAQNEGWDGDGSQEDPYIIEGLEIKTSVTDLITIEDTDMYFQISDNLLDGLITEAPHAKNAVFHGIIFNNVTHGTITSNTIKGINDGIRISNSANITISKNNFTKMMQGINMIRSINISISDNTFFYLATGYEYTTSYARIGHYPLGSVFDVGTGIYSEDSHNNSFSNNELRGEGVWGIHLESSSNNLVSQNTINNYGVGVYSLGSSINNTVIDNVFTNNYYGYAQDPGVALNNVITNNNFSNSKLDGVFYRGENGIISHNIITGNSRDGIAHAGENGVISHNIITGNKRNGIVIGPSGVGHYAIPPNLFTYPYAFSANKTRITENIIANNLDGIFLENSQEAIITNNTIYSNSLYGLRINSSSQNNTIKWNDFLDNNRPHSSLISLTPSSFKAQAFDAGSENLFNANYWFEWTGPDSDRNDIVDEPYFIDGEAQNTDILPSKSAKNPKNCPTIISPRTDLLGVVIVTLIITTFITLGISKSFNRETPEKTVLYLFIIYGLVSIGVFGVNLLRNFNDLINPLFFRPPDIFVLTYGLTVILGSFSTYRLVLYYRETHSIQYILLTVFIFGTAVTMFLWQLWIDYFSRAAVDYSLGLFGNFEPEIIVGQVSYFLGMITLLIFVVRLRPWKEYHILLKSLIILLGYEIICGGLFYWPFGRTLQWLNILPIGYFNDPQFLFNQLSIIYNLNQLKILPAPLSYLSSFQLSVFLINVFVAGAYLTAKTEVKTPKIRISQVFWVIFGLSNILLEFISLFNVENVLGLADPFVWFALLSVKQTILLAGLTILLVTAPEALLITRAQIFQANKLYQKIEKGELELMIPPRIHLLDYKARFIAYLDSLPSELKEELKTIRK